MYCKVDGVKDVKCWCIRIIGNVGDVNVKEIWVMLIN